MSAIDEIRHLQGPKDAAPVPPRFARFNPRERRALDVPQVPFRDQEIATFAWKQALYIDLLKGKPVFTSERGRSRVAVDMEHGRWEHFEHQADMGIRAVAPSREQLFECLGEALTAIVTDPDGVRPLQTVAISCEAPDDEMLLVDWLNALVFEMATRRMLFSKFKVEVAGRKLGATVIGEAVDRARHQPAVEVKGATYTALRVEQDEAGNWRGQCVVDV